MYSGYYEEGIAWVYSKLRYPTMRGWKLCVGFYAREGFGTRRDFFSREAALHGNGAQRIHATLPRRLGHGRKAIADCEIGGYRVTEGTNIFIFQSLTHRDPRFFPNPDSKLATISERAYATTR
jgi:hypothetical protein